MTNHIKLCILFLLLLFSSRIVGQSFVIKTPVNDKGLIANLFEPDTFSIRPAILLVGGSGGGIGWQNYLGEILAQNGFSALALPYFNYEGLPDYLDEIPLEYFEEALRWLQIHPRIDPKKIGIVGVSKGGELALLLGSIFPDFKATVSYVPSSVVFQSLAKGWAKTSSWKYKGKSLAFVPYRITENYNPDTLSIMYTESLEQKEYVEQATIKVEKINGPILLISGKEDTLWPSTAMSEMIMIRLKSHEFPFPYEHIAYDQAGHLISSIRSDAMKRGGTEEGNSFAQRDAQKRMLKFLNTYLKAN